MKPPNLVKTFRAIFIHWSNRQDFHLMFSNIHKRKLVTCYMHSGHLSGAGVWVVATLACMFLVFFTRAMHYFQHHRKENNTS